MQKVQLQYPDETPASKILDDLTVLSRNTGQKGLRGKAAIDPAATNLIAQLGSKLVQRQIPSAAYADDTLPATTAKVNNAAAVTLLPATGTTPAQGSATAAVAASALTGVRLAANRAVVTSGLVINVTGGTVTLTVTNNVVTAAFTAA